ncbi:861_t:CDS:2, partial [Funneliformis geosporum]
INSSSSKSPNSYISEEDNLYDIYIILGMQKLHKWNHRKNATGVIGRLYMIQPIEGKRYYLRILLIHVTGATSFDNLKTVNKQICRTFKKACTYLGLLQNNNKWNKCLYEAKQLWNTYKFALCKDILYNAQQLTLSQTIILNDTIENK